MGFLKAAIVVIISVPILMFIGFLLKKVDIEDKEINKVLKTESVPFIFNIACVAYLFYGIYVLACYLK